MAREAYVEVRVDAGGQWRFVRRAGNHRPGSSSNPYRRQDAAVRAATGTFPDLEVRVFDREGSLDRVVFPDF